jgi:hypothetical protein
MGNPQDALERQPTRMFAFRTRGKSEALRKRSSSECYQEVDQRPDSKSRRGRQVLTNSASSFEPACYYSTSS